MAESCVLINTPGTYDLNGAYANYQAYQIDCTDGNITLNMMQAAFQGFYYWIYRTDTSDYNLYINAYEGDTLNNDYTGYTVPPLTFVLCQTVVPNNWVMPFVPLNVNPSFGIPKLLKKSNDMVITMKDEEIKPVTKKNFTLKNIIKKNNK